MAKWEGTKTDIATILNSDNFVSRIQVCNCPLGLLAWVKNLRLTD